jgi:MYXO-CTERM domain-containing protein
VRLSGTGVSPVLQVAANSMMIDFGNVTIGSMSDSAPVGLRNGGAAAFTIGSIVSTDPEFVVDTAGAMTALNLTPGGLTKFNVSFIPSSEGMKSGTIAITLKGSNTPIATISVTGTGVTPIRRQQMTGCAVSGRRSSSPLPLLLALLPLAGLALRRRRKRA